MAKKKGSSVSKFHSLMESAKDDLQELDKVYSGSASNKSKEEKEIVGETGKEGSPLEEKESSVKEVKEKKEIEVKGKSPLEEKGVSLELEKEEKGEVEEEKKELEENERMSKEEKGVKGKKEKDEKKIFSVSYKITEKFDLAMLILSKSDKFPIRGKTEMLDYILEKFCEKKAIQEILNEGIKF